MFKFTLLTIDNLKIVLKSSDCLATNNRLVYMISANVPVQREGPCEANRPLQRESRNPRHLFQVRPVCAQSGGHAGQVFVNGFLVVGVGMGVDSHH